MRKLLFLLSMLISSCSLYSQFNILELDKATEFRKKEDLSELLSRAENLFLEKLNEFRKAKKTQILSLKSEFELMALNHTIWMRHHDKLTHNQKSGSQFFTGTSLMQRLAYVNDKLKSSLIGENVAYINISTQDQLKPLEELAEQIAQDFFETWKKSPPHKENMLEKTYKFSGVIFLKIGTVIYGTQVFSS